MIRELIGTRFDAELDSTEIVVRMRSEIADYQAAKVLPTDMVILVELGTVGPVDNIDIVIKDTGAGRVFLDSYLEGLDDWPAEEEMYQRTFRGALAHLRLIRKKWHRGLSGPAPDFFEQNYRGQVRLDFDTYLALVTTEGAQ